MTRKARVLPLLVFMGPVAEAAPAADLGPCSAFTDDATNVSSTLIMQLEHRRVPLRVPIQYFEDAWDRVDGVETTAQLFRVDINEFSPVTRPQTGERNMAGRHDYMWFTIGDQISTRDIALMLVNLAWNNPSLTQKLVELPPAKGSQAGLVWLDTSAASGTAHPYADIYVAFGSDGKDVVTAIECFSPKDKTRAAPVCQQYFTAGKVDVNLSYDRTYLDRWRTIQADITNFVTCASKP